MQCRAKGCSRCRSRPLISPHNRGTYNDHSALKDYFTHSQIKLLLNMKDGFG
jgi:hypothetical protein